MTALVLRLAEPDQTGLIGENHSLNAVTKPELAEQARDVRLDCRLADDELGCDLRVRKTAGEQPQHLGLARGELPEHLARLGAGRQRGGEPLEQPARYRRGEQRVAAGDDSDRFDQL